MTPQEFMEYWNISRAELRQLLNKSKSTVDQWFSPSSDMVAPPDVQKRLEEIHCRFLQWKLEDEITPELRQLYELIQERQGNR